MEQIKAEITTVGIQLKKLRDAITRPLWVDPNSSRIKATIDTVTTVTTCGTVTTVTGITNIGGHDAKQAMIYPLDRANWAQAVRTRIH
jgi:polyisoprenoid-binding protein YceI